MNQMLEDESGAVTVDWVVLTGALVGLGLATMGVVSGGVEDVSGDVREEMSGQMIYATFDQRSFSDYYATIVAFEATGGLGEGAAAELDRFLGDKRALDDAALVADLESRIGKIDTQWQPLLDALATIDPATVTVAELSAAFIAEGQTSYTESVVQNSVDRHFGGSVEAYAEYTRLLRSMKIASVDAQRQIAAERGLTWVE